MRTPLETTEARAAVRSRLWATHRSFGILSVVDFSRFYASHVRLRLERGGFSVFLCRAADMADLEHVIRCTTWLTGKLCCAKYEGRLYLFKLNLPINQTLREDSFFIWMIHCDGTGLELCDYHRPRVHHFSLRKLESAGFLLMCSIFKHTDTLSVIVEKRIKIGLG